MRFVVYDMGGCEICRNQMPYNGIKNFYRVLFIFDQDDMLYEIQQLAAAQADAAKVKDDVTAGALEQFRDVCADDNLDRPLRTIPLAISKCERILHHWTQQPFGKHTSLKNDQDDRKEFFMELKVEEHFSSDIAWALIRNIQEYIEAFVLYDWAGVTYPDGKKHWTERLIEVEAEMKEMLQYMHDECSAFIPPAW